MKAPRAAVPRDRVLCQSEKVDSAVSEQWFRWENVQGVKVCRMCNLEPFVQQQLVATGAAAVRNSALVHPSIFFCLSGYSGSRLSRALRSSSSSLQETLFPLLLREREALPGQSGHVVPPARTNPGPLSSAPISPKGKRLEVCSP